MSDLVCYCFGYTKADIVNDCKANGKSLIVERIAAAKRMGTCQCEEKNPKHT